ncbi:hypothetical protein Tco_1226747 [Tanacetum coccineum]
MGYEDGNYLAHTDFIQLRRLSKNGNGPVSFTTDTSGQIKILPPKTAEEIVARERERKARTTLLMAIPEDHLAKFHKMTDAKEMCSTNDVSTAYGVSNTSGQNSKLEQTSSYSLLASQSSCLNGSEEINQEVLQGKMIERHFARECRTKEDNRRRDGWNPGNKDGSRTGKKEESKALVTVDGESVDWTTHSEDDENFAFMASNSSGSDTQVPSCSNECKESYANLKRLYDAQREQLSDASVKNKGPYTQGLKKVEAQLVAHQQGQLWAIKVILNASSPPTHEMQAVPPPMIGNYMPSGLDIEIDDSQYTYGPQKTQLSESESQTTELDTCDSNISTETSELVSEPVVNESNIEVQPEVWSDAPIIEEYESDSDDEYVSVKIKGLDTPSFANKQVKTPRENVKNQSAHSQKPKDNPQRTLKNKGIIDSGCSRHMTGNKAYLADFQDFNGGPVAFGGSKGYITSKGKIKTGKLDFEDVSFVKELWHFNPLLLCHNDL